MKINCVSCGHNIELDDAYADHYEGEIKCFGCDARLEIRTEQSSVRFVHLAGSPAGVSVSADGARSPTMTFEAAHNGRRRSYKAHNATKQAAAPLSKGGIQHAPPPSQRPL